jgi:hypothetical protein
MTERHRLAEEIRDRTGYEASAEELAEVAGLLDAIAALPEAGPLTAPATRFDPAQKGPRHADAD